MSKSATPKTPMSSVFSASPKTPHSAMGGPKKIEPPKEVAEIKSLVNAMKEGLQTLDLNLDVMEGYTHNVMVLGGDENFKRGVNQMRTYISKRERYQQDGIDNIKALLQDVLDVQIMNDLQKGIEEEINEFFEEIVNDEVKKILDVHIPKELQDEVAKHKRELEEAQRELHNSESRRANAALHDSRPQESLSTIQRMNGEVSAVYPKDLQSLFDVDAETAKQLMVDYELPEISDNRVRNLNRFMRFCGVSYQLIESGEGYIRIRVCLGNGVGGWTTGA